MMENATMSNEMMQPETIETQWIIIDGINGLSVYPLDHCSIMDAIEDYGFDAICSIDVEYGVCARLSMPGFLDATDWTGPFINETSALESLEILHCED